MAKEVRHRPVAGEQVALSSGLHRNPVVEAASVVRRESVRALGFHSGASTLDLIAASRATLLPESEAASPANKGVSAATSKLRVVVGRPMRLDPAGKNSLTSLTSEQAKPLAVISVDARRATDRPLRE